jgi:hypothetical protein
MLFAEDCGRGEVTNSLSFLAAWSSLCIQAALIIVLKILLQNIVIHNSD